MLENINYNLYRIKYRYGQYLPLRAPVDVSLELSSSCNMACSYCYHADPKNVPFKMGIMKKDVAMKIITESFYAGVNSLKFNWKGESTLNPHYAEITAYAKSLARGGVFIDRLANSNFKIPFKKRDAAFSALCNLTKVKVSYDSLNKSVFEKQRAGGDHDLTTKNIDLFHNLPERKKSGTKIVLQAVRTNLNLNEDFSKFKARWPDAEISIRDVVEGRVEKDVSEYTHKDRDDSGRQSCKQAHVRLIFNHDGKALPCCPDIAEKHNLGNIENETVAEIFNGLRARNLRKSLKSGNAFDNDPCKNCSSFESFKGYKAPWGS